MPCVTLPAMRDVLELKSNPDSLRVALVSVLKGDKGDAPDASAISDAVTDWLDANGVTGAVRYDAAQSLTAGEIEQAQENLDLNGEDFALIYQTAKL